jgi:hypothetical protein
MMPPRGVKQDFQKKTDISLLVRRKYPIQHSLPKTLPLVETHLLLKAKARIQSYPGL